MAYRSNLAEQGPPPVPPKIGRWIRARAYGSSPSGKTKIWGIETLDGVTLGVVKFVTNWRKYIFAPAADTVYEQDCLRDIAAFCEQKTSEHKQKRAANR